MNDQLKYIRALPLIKNQIANGKMFKVHSDNYSSMMLKKKEAEESTEKTQWRVTNMEDIKSTVSPPSRFNTFLNQDTAMINDEQESAFSRNMKRTDFKFNRAQPMFSVGANSPRLRLCRQQQTATKQELYQIENQMTPYKQEDINRPKTIAGIRETRILRENNSVGADVSLRLS